MKTVSKKKLLSYVFVLVIGVFSSFSLPPYNFFLINFITIPSLFVLLVKQRFKLKKIENFFYGWIFGFGYFLSSLYWITISLTFDETFKVLIPIAILLIPSFLGIFYGLATFIFSYFKKFSNVSLVLAFSTLFSISEFLRGHILSGFPWNLISFSFSEFLPLLQILSFTGTYTFNLLCLTLFTLPSFFYLKKNKFDMYFSILFGLLTILVIIFGQFTINESKYSDSKKK